MEAGERKLASRQGSNAELLGIKSWGGAVKWFGVMRVDVDGADSWSFIVYLLAYLHHAVSSVCWICQRPVIYGLRSAHRCRFLLQKCNGTAASGG